MSWSHLKLICDAYSLDRIARFSIRKIKDSPREDLKNMEMHVLLSFLIGMYYETIKYHKAVVGLILSGHASCAFNLIRSQLEALLIFLYFVDPGEDIQEVQNRTNEYQNWIAIKMYDNNKKSIRLDLLKDFLDNDEYIGNLERNYNGVKAELSESEFKRLEKSHSFLKNKPQIAEKYDFKDLYNHIQAESSASIHIADISDRLNWVEEPFYVGYEYNENGVVPFWPLLLTNALQVYLLLGFTRFFKLQKSLLPKLEKWAEKLG